MTACTNGSNTKVLVIGLDGASPLIISQLIADGKLPMFGEIAENGVSGTLMSVFPPVSPTAWASFMTGVNPGKHGILDFEIRLTSDYKRYIVNAKYIRCDTIWSILSRRNKKVGVIHVPLTYPPPKVRGFAVAGYALSPGPATYPSNLLSEIDKAVPGYINAYSRVYRYIPGREVEYVTSLLFVTDLEKKVALYLMRNYEWDVLTTVFFFLDQIQHYMWRFYDPTHPLYDESAPSFLKNAIPNFYKKLDTIIRELINNITDDAIIFIISDHGFGPLYKDVYINHWLMKLGLLKLKRSKVLMRKLLSILSRERLTTLFYKLRLSHPVLMNIPRHFIKSIFGRLPRARITLSDIDFKKTRAYSTGYVGQIFLNVKGRDKEGIISPGDEYERLRDYIIQKLKELRNPEDGRPLVDEIFKKEDIYHGPHASYAADILFVMREMSYITHGAWTRGEALEFGPSFDALIGPPPTLESGWHRMEGVFMAYGPYIRKLTNIQAQIIDLAPTILHIMNTAIPSYMDGKVLKEIFKPTSPFARRRVKFSSYFKTIKKIRRARTRGA